MSLRRFFVEQEEIIGSQVFMTSEYAHAAKVLRAKAGDIFAISTGDGIDRKCKVTEITKDTVIMDIIEEYPNKAELPISITLFQGVIKGNAMDWCVEKAVELGVDKIKTFVSAYTVADCGESKAQRLTLIAKQAAKQCGRAALVEVEPSISFKKVVECITGYDLAIFCSERGGKRLTHVLDEAKIEEKMTQVYRPKIAIIVGSEGGFDETECYLLSQYARAVTLGARILRAETAGLYVNSVLGQRYAND